MQEKCTNKKREEHPVAVYFTIEWKRYYYNVPEIVCQIEKRFDEVCSVVCIRSQLMSVENAWEKVVLSQC